MPAVMLLLAVLSAGAEEPAKEAAEFKPLRVMARPEQAQRLFKAQLLGELDHPVGGKIEIGGTIIKVEEGGKGELLLEIDGRKRTLGRGPKAVPIKLQRKDKRTIQACLYFQPKGDGVWTYRNLTVFRLFVGQEQLLLVDANGNGVYNEAGKDGMAWEGYEFLWPVPAKDERWCTQKLELTGLEIEPLGEEVKVSGRPLETRHQAALPVLLDANEERSKLGMTPRPEDPEISDAAQKHCNYMALNNYLGHSEDEGRPGYTREGAASAARSILSMGRGAAKVAEGFVATLWHRQDVIRPDTFLFGVGNKGSYSAIDGREGRGGAESHWWPVLCPAPNQNQVPLNFRHESPEPVPAGVRAGFPVTAYFGTRNLKMNGYTLKKVNGPQTGENIDCWMYGPNLDKQNNMATYQHVVAIIPKAPLSGGTIYEVTFDIEVDGAARKLTWRFCTVGAPKL